MPTNNLPAGYMPVAGLDTVRVMDSGGTEDQPSIIVRFSSDHTAIRQPGVDPTRQLG